MLFANNTTFTIAGTLTLTGSTGNEITLNSTDDTNRFTFNVTGGVQTVTFVNVSNAAADSHNIVTVDSIDGGNNDNYEPVPHWALGIIPIYRSVGPGATGDLNVNNLTVEITGTTATFSDAMPDNVGVGDVLQYNSGSVTVAFISGRTSSTVYTVQSASGDAPDPAPAATSVNVYRAYTSLANAEAGTENTALDDTVENFDTWSGGRDLSAATGSNEQWNIACYANGTTADTTAVYLDGWYTSSVNYIRIYTPVSSSEVGVSQRHSGKWDDHKYHMETQGVGVAVANADLSTGSTANAVRVNGFQIFVNPIDFGEGDINGVGIVFTSLADGHVFQASHNIVKGLSDATANLQYGIGIGESSSGETAMFNNIIYDMTGSDGGFGIVAMDFTGTSNIYVSNNTVYDSTAGFYAVMNGSLLRNNLAVNNGQDYLVMMINAASANNISSDATSPNVGAADCGGHSCLNQVVLFTDAENDDFHLSVYDASAKDAGADQSGDPSLPFDTDIDGQPRPYGAEWDIGADENYAMTWDNSSSNGLWSTAANWTGDVAPTTGDDVTFDNTSTDDCTIDIHTGAGQLTIAANYTGTISQSADMTFTVGSNTWTMSGGTFNAGNESTDINGTFILNGGRLNAQSGTMYFSGDVSLASGVWNRGSGSIVFDGDLTLTDTILANLGTVFIGSSPDTVTLATDVTMDVLTIDEGDMLVTNGYDIDLTGAITVNGTLDASGAADDGTTMEVGGNWTTSSTGTVWFASTSTVTFDGTSDQTVAAYSGSFQNVTVTNSGTITFSEAFTILGNFTNETAQSSMLFAPNTTFTIAGTLTLTGSTGNEITLNSTDDTNRFTFDVTGGTQTVTFLNVSNAAADSHNIITEDSIDGGNNDNYENAPHWSFDTIIIYRSVGPGATGALDTGAADSNQLTINGTTATFTIAVPNSVGVGDAIQYDINGDDQITAADGIVFITSRVSSTEYTVQQASGAPPVAVTADTSWSIFRAYTSLANAETGTENTGIDADLRNFDTWSGGKDLTPETGSNEQWNIACYANGTNEDTATATISGWTTSQANYLRIYTPISSAEVGTNQRHPGKWDNTKYYRRKLDIADNYVRIDGLQLTLAKNDEIIQFSDNAVDTRISNNIFRGNTSYTIEGICTSGGSGNAYIWNNIFYDLTHVSGGAIHGANLTRIYVFNNTFVGNVRGITADTAEVPYLVNNIFYDNTVDISGTFYSSSNYNIFGGTTSTGGAEDRVSQTPAFVDPGNDDYRLANNDTAARDQGTDLSADPDLAFSTDLEGQTRFTGLWDIGADEGVNIIYRSVGPGATDDLNTGGATVEISGTTATFSEAMPDNIGVGDVLQYTSGSVTVAFISGRVSDTVYTVKNAAGGQPLAAPALTAVNIYRAYISLFNAEEGTENTALDDTVENFDTWTAGKDLTSSEEQWNIACYKNGATTDQTPVLIDDWTTSSIQYVRIFTPYRSTEVGESQRHNGTRGSGYRMELTSNTTLISNRTHYTIIDGLELDGNDTTGSQILRTGEWVGGSTARYSVVENCFVYDHAYRGIAVGDYETETVIRNNFVAGIDNSGVGAIQIGPEVKATRYRVYNNTVINSGLGFSHSSTGEQYAYFFNNVAWNNTVDYDSNLASLSDDSHADYNYSQDDTAPGSHSIHGTTDGVVPGFVSAADGSENMHIDSTSGLIGQGTSLATATYSPFAYDIDMQPRGTTWDMGADEFGENNVYYSVGQNTDNHSSGGNVSITTGVATFTTAQTATNLGVGDKLTAGGNVFYLASKNSTTSWNVVTATGGIPVDQGLSAVTSITHAFDSLSDAIAGASDADHLNTTDLAAGHYVLNIPCYYDTGADTTAVLVDGYTTGANNYIHIYTPTDTFTECNQRQRHYGTWDNSKYSLDITDSYAIQITDNYVNVDGLQIKVTASSGTNANGIMTPNNDFGTGEIRISNNILSGSLSGTVDYTDALSLRADNVGMVHYVWNNIAYGWSRAGSTITGAYYSEDSAAYVYNNTAADCMQGLYKAGAGSLIAINNIVKGSGDADAYVGTFAAGTDYNATDGADDIGVGTHNRTGRTIVFVDENNNDFRIAPIDMSVKDAGADLSADVNLSFSTDIQGQTRSGSWDIGADEVALVTWDNGSADGLWSTPANWSTDLVPEGSDVAFFDITSVTDCTIDTTVTAGSITIGAGYTGSITQSSNYAVLLNSGTLYQTSGIFAAGSGSITVGGTFTLGGGTFTTSSGYLDVNSTFTLSGGRLNAQSGTMYISGDMSLASGVWNRGSGSIVFDGDLSLTDTILANLGTVFIGSLSDTITLADDVSIDVLTIDEGDMLVTAGYDIDLTGAITVNGTLDAVGTLDDGTTMEVGGDWSTGSTGTVWFGSTSTVTFDGTSDQTVAAYSGSFQDIAVTNSGTVTFSQAFTANGDFTNTTAGSSMLFANNVTFTIAGSLTLTGSTGNEITLNSTDDTNRFTFDVTGGTQTVTFVNISNSQVDSNDIYAQASISSGNNDNTEDSPHWVITSTAIYRSIAPGATTALDTGSADSNQLTINGTTATFSIAVANNVGVGDAIQYDVNGDSVIDTNDAVAFITGRVSSTEYTVQTAAGGTPTAVTGDTDWSIFRAYTSLTNAESGTENTGIDADLRNFDTWSDGKDISGATGSNENWNFACYGNGTTADELSSAWYIGSGWTLSSLNYIRIYSPYLSTEVGISQRHTGVFEANKYYINHTSATQYSALIVYQYVNVDGLQIVKNGTSTDSTAISTDGGVISNNLIISQTNTIFNLGILGDNATTYYVFNNIIYKTSAGGIRLDNDSGTMYAYNNTVVDVSDYWGIAKYSAGGTLIAKNNIVQDTNGDCYYGTFTDSDYNISDDASDTDGANDITSTTVIFADEANLDFHLSFNDTEARGAGADLTADTAITAAMGITSDVDGHSRPSGSAWDIGADQAAKHIFYSVGQNTDDHSSGGNVSITNGLATFDTPQTGAAFGVGDVLTAGGNTYYISSKQDTSNWNVVTASGEEPADLGSTAVTSVTHAFDSLSDAETNAPTLLGTNDLYTGNYVLNIPCYYDSGADTTNVTIEGWTTAAPNYIKFYTPSSVSTEVNLTQRHSGRWDDRKYRLEISAAGIQRPVNIAESYVRIDGLQVLITNNGFNYNDAIGAFNGFTDLSNDIRISNNILRAGILTTNPAYGFNAYSDCNVKLWNNIAYNFTDGGGFRIGTGGGNTGTYYAYNNTAYNNEAGFAGGGGTVILKNNLAYGNTTDYSGTLFDTGSVYNLSSDDTADDDADMLNSIIDADVAFVDAANNDFHLAFADAAARNAGADLSADANFAFATDIDGHARPAGSTWDIGADEGAIHVFYSVGQNTADHMTGAPTITIADGVATFSEPQTATNMGVGDAITYGTGTVAFITGKTSTSVWNVSTATGETPTNIDGSSVTSITHAFDSLNAAFDGADEAAFLNTTDLSTNNYQLNFPCYYDSAADTATVWVDGYTTSPNNIIKIYTPSSTVSESNQSQRHAGKWDDSKYRLEVSGDTAIQGNMGVNYLRLEGLQIKVTNTSGSGPYFGVWSQNVGTGATYWISGNIIKGVYSGAGSTGGGIGSNGSVNYRIWNNIIYDFINADDDIVYGAMWGGWATGYIYNNSLIDNAYGIQGWSGTAIAKNNIVKGSGDANAYVGGFTAGTDYNATDGTDDIGTGANNRLSQIFAFINEANDVFHLARTDTGAKNAGENVSSDTYFAFSVDIQGQARTGTWDIGADEVVDVTWDNGSTDGLWSTPTNWSTDAVPAGSDNAMFDTTSLSDCTIQRQCPAVLRSVRGTPVRSARAAITRS
jgi:hypothetical protein